MTSQCRRGLLDHFPGSTSGLWMPSLVTELIVKGEGNNRKLGFSVDGNVRHNEHPILSFAAVQYLLREGAQSVALRTQQIF